MLGAPFERRVKRKEKREVYEYFLSSIFPLDLFGFERYTFLAEGGWSYHFFSTRLRVLKLTSLQLT